MIYIYEYLWFCEWNRRKKNDLKSSQFSSGQKDDKILIWIDFNLL